MKPLLRLFIPLLLSASASTSLASGGVNCYKLEKSPPAVSLSWGSGHVTGNGRISPYLLSLSGRQIAISDYDDPKHVRTKQASEKTQAREVGYWNGDDRILVWLADDQVLKTLLELKVEKQKSGDYAGKLIVKDLAGISMADINVTCTKE